MLKRLKQEFVKLVPTAVFYLSAAFIVRYLEYLIPFVWEYRDLVLANSHMLNEVVWPHFLLVQVWLFVIFFVYSVITEFVRVLGRERVNGMFFGQP